MFRESFERRPISEIMFDSDPLPRVNGWRRLCPCVAAGRSGDGGPATDSFGLS